MKQTICLMICFLLLAPLVIAAEQQKESAILGQILKEQKDIKRIITTEIKQQTEALKQHQEETLNKKADELYKHVQDFKRQIILQLTSALVAGVVLGFLIKEFIAIRLRRIRLALRKKQYEDMFKKYERKKQQLEAEIKLLEKKIEKTEELPSVPLIPSSYVSKKQPLLLYVILAVIGTLILAYILFKVI